MNERVTNLSDAVRGELRKQQVTFKDITIENGKVTTYRIRLNVSFKYDGAVSGKSRSKSTTRARR